MKVFCLNIFIIFLVWLPWMFLHHFDRVCTWRQELVKFASSLVGHVYLVSIVRCLECFLFPLWIWECLMNQNNMYVVHAQMKKTKCTSWSSGCDSIDRRRWSVNKFKYHEWLYFIDSPEWPMLMYCDIRHLRNCAVRTQYTQYNFPVGHIDEGITRSVLCNL